MKLKIKSLIGLIITSCMALNGTVSSFAISPSENTVSLIYSLSDVTYNENQISDAETVPLSSFTLNEDIVTSQNNFIKGEIPQNISSEIQISNNSHPESNHTLNGTDVTDDSSSVSLMSTLPNGGPYFMAGTNVSLYYNNGTATFKGSGTLEGECLSLYANSVINIVVSENVIIGVGAFANLHKLKTVTFNGSATTIGNDAFNGCVALSTVTLSNKIKTIGERVFFGCTSLQKITIGTSLTSVSYGAFYNCTSLNSISLTSNITSIADFAFGNCKELNSVTMTSVKTIGKCAFLNCDKLSFVSFGNVLQSVDDEAFYGCSALIKAELPQTLTSIGARSFAYCNSLQEIAMGSCSSLGTCAFLECTNLISVVLPDELKETGGYSFALCDNLKSITLSSNMTHINSYEFFYCTSLESITIPNNVQYIGEAAFYFCENLESITFPDSYTDIDQYAFSYCNKAYTKNETVKIRNVGEQAFINTPILKNIEFSKDTTKIANAAFQGCSRLTSVNFNACTVSVGENAFFACPEFTTAETAPTFVAVEKAAFYECAGLESVIFAKECTTIGEGAFYRCSNLADIDFSNCSAKIGDGAFYECTSLSDIKLSPNCTGFGTGCFYGCSSLKTVDFSNLTLPISDHMFTDAVSLEILNGESNIISVGKYAFYSTNLTDITGMASVMSLGEGSFAKCNSLKNISIGSSVTELPQAVFMECKALENITIPSTVKAIGAGAFAECDALKTIIIPDTVVEIQKYTFSHCDSLEYVYGGVNIINIAENSFAFCKNLKNTAFTDKLEKVGDYAFCECSSLTSFADTTNITNIGEGTFYKCSGIKTLNFTSMLTSVGKYAFEYCTGLESVNFDNGLTVFDDEIFAYCSSLKSIEIPSTVTSIKENVFYECDSLTYVEIPEKLVSLGNGVFFNCDNLIETYIPDTVSQMGFSCFYGCKSLKRASLPKNLSLVSKGTFYNCTSLESIVLPQDAMELGLSSFFGCRSLKKVDLPDSLKIIDDYTFAYCENLTDVILPNTLKSVGEYAFAYCESLENIEIPRNVTNIEPYTFYCDLKLEEVKYMGDIMGIGTAAFYDCENLKAVYFYGKTPELIGDKTFYNTPDDLVLYGSSLNEDWTTPQWTGSDGNTYNTDVIYPPTNGICGENVKWQYYPEKLLLVISGKGEMYNYSESKDVPWSNYITNITTIQIKDGVTHIGDRAFSELPVLKSVYMCDSVVTCGDYSFAKCDNLVYVKLPDRLTNLGKYAFYNCSTVTQMVLPSSVKEIGAYAFFGCSSMKSISLPNSLSFLGEGAFFNCSGIKNAVLSPSIEKVSDYAFSGCTNLESILLSYGTKTVEKSAFSGCTALKEVYVLGGNVYIADLAFSGCKNLMYIHFSDSEPEYLGHNALFGVPAETVVYYSNDTAWNSETLSTKDGRTINCVSDSSTSSGRCGNDLNWKYYGNGVLLIEGSGDMTDYSQGAAPWNSYKDKIKHITVSDGVTSIGDYAFSNHSRLESVSLGKTVLSVGKGAFSDCDRLERIDLPENLQQIGQSAFYHCSGLIEIKLPSEIKTVEDYTFALCSGLNKAELSSGLKKIGYSAFYSCGNLTIINIPGSVSEISDWAFARCVKIDHITLPDRVLLGKHAFFGCESLTEFDIPESMTKIPSYMLAGTSIKKISIPENVKTIEERAFWGCKNLEEVSLSGVVTIDNYAFFESGLKTIEIPAQTTYIGSYAFGMCNRLESIKVDSSNSYFCDIDGVLHNKSADSLLQYPIGKSQKSYFVDTDVTKIEKGAFYGSRLSEISVMRTVTHIGEAAFANCINLRKMIIPDEITKIQAGTFYGCYELETVEFLGEAPIEIGEDAFSCTDKDMIFVYTDGESGWTDIEWNGPDGQIYSTAAKSAMACDLRLYKVAYDETTNEVTYSLNISNNGFDVQNATLAVGIYNQNGKLVALGSSKKKLDSYAIYDTCFKITGSEIEKDFIIKAFLWNDNGVIPLSKNFASVNRYDISGNSGINIEFGDFTITEEPLPPVDPDYSMGYYLDEGVTLTSSEELLSTFSVSMSINHSDMSNMLENAARNNIGNMALNITSTYMENSKTTDYSSSLNIAYFDVMYGYDSNNINVQNPGYNQDTASGYKYWMPYKYSDSRVSSLCRILANTEKGELSDFKITLSETQFNTVDFKIRSERVFSVTETEFAPFGNNPVSKFEADDTYYITIPFEDTNLMFNIDINKLIDAIVGSTGFAELVTDSEKNINEFNVTMNVVDVNQETKVLFSLRILTDGEEKDITDVSVLEYAQYEGEVEDFTYNPIDYDTSIDASESLPLCISNVSPQKSSTGKVTMKLTGTMMEAGAKLYLTNDSTSFEATEIYYFEHSKLYATFDLSKATNGVYDVKLVQKDKEFIYPQCFTVDSSLPKGKLTAKINVDKKASVNKVYNGSITYTNTGYTDVYAPVILIDCGNIELQSVDSNTWFTQETVFVENQSGLAGIITNGETATYNFKYRLKDKGFSLNVYNYADITKNVTDDIELTPKSTSTDIFNYNINKLTGVRACDYAASIAKMASYQSSIGGTCTDVDELRNAYITDAQGTLALSTIISSVDISSRELSFERYYSADVAARQREGLFGPGWISDFDITVELVEGKSSDSENVIVITKGTDAEFYTLKDGIYTESFYGLSTAEKTDDGIVIRHSDDSSYMFNSYGKLAKICDVYGNYIELIYNTDKKLSEVITSNDDRLVFTYADGRISSIESPITGRRAKYSYSNGFLISFSNEYGTVSYQYDVNSIGGRRNSLKKVLFSSGEYQEYDYDEHGRVIAIRNDEGEIKYSYPGGNCVEVTDVNGDKTRMQYDTSGLLKRMVDNTGSSVESTHSDKILNTSSKFGILNEIKYDYDEKHNLTGITDFAGNKTSYSYNEKGNLINVTDKRGISTDYIRTDIGELQKLVYSDGNFESYQYDDKGNIISAVKRDGTQISYTYNEFSQLKEINYSTGQYIKYAYDAKGNPTLINENGNETKLEYTNRGDIKRITYPNYSSVEYSYDEFGNVIQAVANYGSISRQQNYKYDDKCRLTAVMWYGLDMVSYEYNPDGSLKRETSYNGAYTEYEYKHGLLKSIKNYNSDETLLSFFEYSYDEFGNMISVNENEGTWSYRYDKGGQLTHVISPNNETTVYTYDLSGNRTSVVTKDGVVNYNSNELNQYTSYGSATRKYDENGNLISQTDEDGTTTYEYDYMDRLVRTVLPGGKIVTYTYDVFGNRSSVNNDGELTEFINTPMGYGYPLASVRNNSLESDYIQGNGLAGRVVYNPGEKALAFYDYAYNHLGSTTDITDEYGNVVNCYTYDHEGKVMSSIEGIENPFTYVGRYGITNDKNGLYYARARYISADTMSFISPDPIGQNADLNLYRYAGNNPVLCVDLSGKEVVTCMFVGSLLLYAALGIAGVYIISNNTKEISDTLTYIGNNMVKGAIFIGDATKNIYYSIRGIGGFGNNSYGNYRSNGSNGSNKGPGNDPELFDAFIKTATVNEVGKVTNELIKGAAAQHNAKTILFNFLKKWFKGIGTGSAAPVNLPQANAIMNIPTKNYIANNIYSAVDNSINSMSVVTLNVKAKDPVYSTNAGLEYFMQKNGSAYNDGQNIWVSDGLGKITITPISKNPIDTLFNGLWGIIGTAGNWIANLFR